MTRWRAIACRLEVYQGPLALLLRLIEREEMDITQVSLARVTDQYLDYIAQMERVEAEQLAEFLVIAARLVWIKSRALLPKPPVAAQEEEEEDVGEQLVEQLKQYRLFQRAFGFLRQREEAGLRSYLRLSPAPRLERRLDLSDVTVELLASLVRQALQEQPEPPPVGDVVAPMTVSVAERMAHIQERLAAQNEVRFSELLRGCRSRLEVIVTFLAVLEMLRQLRAQAQQEQLFADIVLTPGSGEPLPEMEEEDA